MVAERRCPIDGAAMKPVFTATIRNRYSVQYYSCTACAYVQTEEPYWLEEAYNDPIADTDTGIMERNIHNAVRISAVLKLLNLDQEPLLDLAGGYGILTRLLRDVGFDCKWSDKFCDNLLARRFEASPDDRATALCALEVLEHVVNPLEFLRDAIARHGARFLLFSTEEFKSLPDPDWWYYSRETGQHISFYSLLSLKSLARQLGWHYTPLPRHLHLFSLEPVSRWRSAVLRTHLLYLYAPWALLRMRRYSRTRKDREQPRQKGGVDAH